MINFDVDEIVVVDIKLPDELCAAPANRKFIGCCELERKFSGLMLSTNSKRISQLWFVKNRDPFL